MDKLSFVGVTSIGYPGWETRSFPNSMMQLRHDYNEIQKIQTQLDDVGFANQNDLSDATLSSVLINVSNHENTLESKKQVLEDKIKVLTVTLDKVRKQNEELERNKNILSSNLSSLFKTASAEIKRKDVIINDLRKEIDDLNIKGSVGSRHSRSRQRSHNGHWQHYDVDEGGRPIRARCRRVDEQKKNSNGKHNDDKGSRIQTQLRKALEHSNNKCIRTPNRLKSSVTTKYLERNRKLKMGHKHELKKASKHLSTDQHHQFVEFSTSDETVNGRYKNSGASKSVEELSLVKNIDDTGNKTAEKDWVVSADVLPVNFTEKGATFITQYSKRLFKRIHGVSATKSCNKPTIIDSCNEKLSVKTCDLKENESPTENISEKRSNCNLSFPDLERCVVKSNQSEKSDVDILHLGDSSYNDVSVVTLRQSLGTVSPNENTNISQVDSVVKPVHETLLSPCDSNLRLNPIFVNGFSKFSVNTPVNTVQQDVNCCTSKYKAIRKQTIPSKLQSKTLIRSHKGFGCGNKRISRVKTICESPSKSLYPNPLFTMTSNLVVANATHCKDSKLKYSTEVNPISAENASLDEESSVICSVINTTESMEAPVHETQYNRIMEKLLLKKRKRSTGLFVPVANVYGLKSSSDKEVPDGEHSLIQSEHNGKSGNLCNSFNVRCKRTGAVAALNETKVPTVCSSDIIDSNKSDTDSKQLQHTSGEQSKDLKVQNSSLKLVSKETLLKVVSHNVAIKDNKHIDTEETVNALGGYPSQVTAGLTSTKNTSTDVSDEMYDGRKANPSVFDTALNGLPSTASSNVNLTQAVNVSLTESSAVTKCTSNLKGSIMPLCSISTQCVIKTKPNQNELPNPKFSSESLTTMMTTTIKTVLPILSPPVKPVVAMTDIAMSHQPTLTSLSNDSSNEDSLMTMISKMAKSVPRVSPILSTPAKSQNLESSNEESLMTMLAGISKTPPAKLPVSSSLRLPTDKTDITSIQPSQMTPNLELSIDDSLMNMIAVAGISIDSPAVPLPSALAKTPTINIDVTTTGQISTSNLSFIENVFTASKTDIASTSQLTPTISLAEVSDKSSVSSAIEIATTMLEGVATSNFELSNIKSRIMTDRISKNISPSNTHAKPSTPVTDNAINIALPKATPNIELSSKNSLITTDASSKPALILPSTLSAVKPLTDPTSIITINREITKATPKVTQRSLLNVTENNSHVQEYQNVALKISPVTSANRHRSSERHVDERISKDTTTCSTTNKQRMETIKAANIQDTYPCPNSNLIIDISSSTSNSSVLPKHVVQNVVRDSKVYKRIAPILITPFVSRKACSPFTFDYKNEKVRVCPRESALSISRQKHSTTQLISSPNKRNLTKNIEVVSAGSEHCNFRRSRLVRRANTGKTLTSKEPQKTPRKPSPLDKDVVRKDEGKNDTLLDQLSCKNLAFCKNTLSVGQFQIDSSNEPLHTSETSPVPPKSKDSVGDTRSACVLQSPNEVKNNKFCKEIISDPIIRDTSLSENRNNNQYKLKMSTPIIKENSSNEVINNDDYKGNVSTLTIKESDKKSKCSDRQIESVRRQASKKSGIKIRDESSSDRENDYNLHRRAISPNGVRNNNVYKGNVSNPIINNSDKKSKYSEKQVELGRQASMKSGNKTGDDFLDGGKKIYNIHRRAIVDHKRYSVKENVGYNPNVIQRRHCPDWRCHHRTKSRSPKRFKRFTDKKLLLGKNLLKCNDQERRNRDTRSVSVSPSRMRQYRSPSHMRRYRNPARMRRYRDKRSRNVSYSRVKRFTEKSLQDNSRKKYKEQEWELRLNKEKKYKMNEQNKNILPVGHNHHARNECHNIHNHEARNEFQMMKDIKNKVSYKNSFESEKHVEKPLNISQSHCSVPEWKLTPITVERDESRYDLRMNRRSDLVITPTRLTQESNNSQILSPDVIHATESFKQPQTPTLKRRSGSLLKDNFIVTVNIQSPDRTESIGGKSVVSPVKNFNDTQNVTPISGVGQLVEMPSFADQVGTSTISPSANVVMLRRNCRRRELGDSEASTNLCNAMLVKQSSRSPSGSDVLVKIIGVNASSPNSINNAKSPSVNSGKQVIKTPPDFRQRYAAVFSMQADSSDDEGEVFSSSSSNMSHKSDDSWRPKKHRRKVTCLSLNT